MVRAQSIFQNRIRVLHFITELSTGGAQKALAQLVQNINRDRYHLIACCYYNGNGRFGRKIANQGIEVIDLNVTSNRDPRAIWRLYNLFNEHEPHILHSWLYHANMPGRIFGRIAKIPIIFSSERTMGMEPRYRYWLNRLTSRWTDRVICVSETVARFVESDIGISQDKTVVIANGIEIANYQLEPSKQKILVELGLPSEKIIIGTVARLDHVKRLDNLIHSILQMNDMNDSMIVIVGDGPERTSLTNLIKELKLADRIRLVGQKDDVDSWISAFDIFVLSSQWEGMPNVLLEAMAVAKPVVATRVGGVPEVVIAGETGLLVPPDDPEAMAGAISVLISEPERAQRMGKAGRQRVIDHFDIKTTVKKTEALYDRLLKEKLGLVYQEGVGWVEVQ